MFAIFSAYPTFLVFLAVVLAIVVTMALMPVWIRFLRSSHIGQQVRADGPESHLVKQGTPTMGGVIMLVAVVACALLVGKPTPETFVLLGATVLTGLLGLVDDASKVVKERSLGLTPKMKLVGQFAIATAFVLVAVNCLGIAARGGHPLPGHPRLRASDHRGAHRRRHRHPVALPAVHEHPPGGHVQRREPDRRSGRPGGGHRHDRHDRHGGHRVPLRTCWSPPSSRRRWRAPASGFCGSTPSRPTSSWATPGRSRSAWRWDAWPWSRRRSSCPSSSAACSWPRRCRS